MKLSIHAVGRMKAGPEKELCDRYLDRIGRSGATLGLDFTGLAEIAESRASQASDRQREESEQLLAHAGPASLVILDERGRNLTSPLFAEAIAAMRDGGTRQAVFALGGPDGHDPSIRARAALVWSFGALTWPHQFARIMLAEQLYRATTILSGHPYHRV